MSDRRYTIKWKTQDTDANLSQGEVLKIAQETECEWEGGHLIDKQTKERVASVVRIDPY